MMRCRLIGWRWIYDSVENKVHAGFFFNDTATTEIYTLSLHDALPIYSTPKKFGRKNTGVFKRLVSGEPVAYRKLGQDIMDIGTVPYLIFNLNELPYPDDSSLGLIRRLQFVSFDVTIPKIGRAHV